MRDCRFLLLVFDLGRGWFLIGGSGRGGSFYQWWGSRINFGTVGTGACIILVLCALTPETPQRVTGGKLKADCYLFTVAIFATFLHNNDSVPVLICVLDFQPKLQHFKCNHFGFRECSRA